MLEEIDVAFICEQWESQFGISVKKIFQGHKTLKRIRCLESGVCYFDPPGCLGDDSLYEQLQKFPWYYEQNKWEHTESLRHLKNRLRILEVGCGPGHFVKNLSAVGHDVLGIEQNSAAVELGQSIAGKKVQFKTLEAVAENQTEYFDAVCHFQVLEHIADPIAFLRLCIGCLKVDGVLVIAVPNMNSYLGKIKNCLLNLPPHHATQWSEGALSNLENYLPLKLIVHQTEPTGSMSFRRLGSHKLSSFVWFAIKQLQIPSICSFNADGLGRQISVCTSANYGTCATSSVPENQMNIRLLSSHDAQGGAAKACMRVHQGLLELGCNSQMLVRWKQTCLSTVECTEDSKNLLHKWFTSGHSFLQRWPVLRFQKPDSEFFSLPKSPLKNLAKLCSDADVVNLHWTVSMIHWSTFFSQLPRHIPIVLTLHDMNYFTGGCHYSGNCRRYEQECGHCPCLRSPDENDLSRQIWNQKEDVFSKLDSERVTVVSPSKWLTECASRSKLLGRFECLTIPYGIDSKKFHPFTNSDFRDQNRIPKNARVLIFVAQSIKDHRKGFDLLMSALAELDASAQWVLLALGNIDSIEFQKHEHLKVLPLGYIADQDELVKAYSAADLFVIPSRQDNLPNTVLEAMACGTPTVGFNIGGIPDMIREGETGFIAETTHASSLAEKIVLFFNLDDSKKQKMRENCRNIFESEYRLAIQANAYQDLFQACLLRQTT